MQLKLYLCFTLISVLSYFCILSIAGKKLTHTQEMRVIPCPMMTPDKAICVIRACRLEPD